MKVEAIDSKGNVYIKEVILTMLNHAQVISFGGPVEYYADDLAKRYPYDKDCCIDIGGLNHRGIPGVCIKPKEMNRMLEKLVPSRCGKGIIIISLESAQEFVDWAKDKAFCNSGQHICDRLASEFEEQLETKTEEIEGK